MIVASILVTLLACAAAWDVMKLRIPNPIPAAIGALFVIPVVFGGAELDFWNHLAAFSVFLVIGWGVFALGFMGGGDVKLFASVALWIGVDLLVLHLVYVALLGLVLLAVLLPARHVTQVIKGQLRVAQGRALPEALLPGEGIPYGVAISAATLLIMNKMPASLWVF